MIKTFTFDDVLIKPKYSDINSRSEVKTSVSLGPIKLGIPLIISPMDTISSSKSCLAISFLGGLGILHRFQSIEKQLTELLLVKESGGDCGAAIGLDDGIERADRLYEVGCDIFVIDVANGHNQRIGQFTQELRNRHKDVVIIAGSVATLEGAEFLKKHGADIIRLGIGSGSACLTRIKTGVGVPQLSAIIDAVQSNIPIISDGGVKTPGDFSKAIAAGASAVMCGRIFAGLEESPIYGMYRGMASQEVMDEYKKSQDWKTSEGVSYTVKQSGSVLSVVQDMIGGLRSSMSYVGARTIKEFQKNAEFIMVSNSTVIENGAHGK